MTAETKSRSESAPTSHIVLLVFLPFAGGYFLSYLYRSVNAVIAPDLVADLGLSPADLGLLTAAYFLAFACFQLPLGVLLDRFGPRRVQSMLLLSAAIGAVVFSLGENMAVLTLGRALIGLGVAGGLMASFKAITLWFPKERWPLVNGCFLAMGGLGAMTATTPVEILLGITDWRGIFLALSAATAAVSALIFTLVPRRSERPSAEPLRQQIAGIRNIYKDRFFWRVAPLTVTTMGSGLAIQGLWAGPWLRDIAGREPLGVANGLFLITLALTIGFLGVGFLADLLRRYGISSLTVLAADLLIFMLAQLAIVIDIADGGLWPWLLFALASNGAALAYAALSNHFPLHFAGRANTGLNMLVFFMAFGLQYAIGAVIGLWPETESGGYAREGYAVAFSLCLAMQVLSFLWFLKPVRAVDR